MISIEDIGLTVDELEDRLITKAAHDLLHRTTAGDDGDMYEISSKFKHDLEKKIQEKIDASFEAICDNHIIPNAEKWIESLEFKSTNRFGEKTGEPMKLMEYLSHRCQNYMDEPVNYEGKTKKQSGNYSWSQKSTRLVYLVDKFLHHKIESEMKSAVSDINKSLEKGLAEAVKIAIADISKKIKVAVHTK